MRRGARSSGIASGMKSGRGCRLSTMGSWITLAAFVWSWEAVKRKRTLFLQQHLMVQTVHRFWRPRNLHMSSVVSKRVVHQSVRSWLLFDFLRLCKQRWVGKVEKDGKRWSSIGVGINHSSFGALKPPQLLSDQFTSPTKHTNLQKVLPILIPYCKYSFFFFFLNHEDKSFSSLDV